MGLGEWKVLGVISFDIVSDISRLARERTLLGQFAQNRYLGRTKLCQAWLAVGPMLSSSSGFHPVVPLRPTVDHARYQRQGDLLQAVLRIRIEGRRKGVHIQRPTFPIGVESLSIHHLSVGKR